MIIDRYARSANLSEPIVSDPMLQGLDWILVDPRLFALVRRKPPPSHIKSLPGPETTSGTGPESGGKVKVVYRFNTTAWYLSQMKPLPPISHRIIHLVETRQLKAYSLYD